MNGGHITLNRANWVKFYGWPADGVVLVLKMASMDAWEKGLGRIHNAFTMEERCREIEKLGGVFYANPKDCPDLDLPWEYTHHKFWME